MNTVERILYLANERGISQTYIINKLGLKSRSFFKDVQKRGGEISHDRLILIAQILETSVDYLTGKSDLKEKPASDGELSKLKKELIDLIRDIPEEQAELVLNLLKSFLKEK